MSGEAEIYDHRRWSTAAAVGLLAFMAGAGVTRIPQVTRALQKLNWSNVIENVIGAGIPLAVTGAIGVLIGRRLSLHSAVELHKAVSDLDEQRQRDRASDELAQGRRRQDLWRALRVVANADTLRYSAGWQGQRPCTHPIEELIDGTPSVVSAVQDLVDDGVIELEETASKLRAIVRALPSARARVDRLGITWTGKDMTDPESCDPIERSDALRVFDNLASALEAIGRAAWVHAVFIGSDPTGSSELTAAMDTVDRCFQEVGP